MKQKGDRTPFDSRVQFEFADLIYWRNQMPKTQINDLLDMWTASMLFAHNDLTESAAPFSDANGMLAAIDAIEVGDTPWQSFVCERQADLPDDAPQWMTNGYEVWYRDVDRTVQNMLANPDFAGEFDFTPYHEYNAKGERRYCDFFSADWAWDQAVSIVFRSKFRSRSDPLRIHLGLDMRRRRQRWRDVRAPHPR